MQRSRLLANQILWTSLLFQIALYAQAAPPVIQYQLDNGLKVVLQEDHRAPVISVEVWYGVGGIDEPTGLTGVSHALEHMMLKGSKQVAPGQFDSILNHLGASNNAYTSNDYTAYVSSMPNNRLPVILALEADRMRGASISEKEFQSEHQVILEEWRNSYLDNPQRFLWEHFQALAYPVSPYRQPVLGWPEDIKALSSQKLKPWYDTWYHPNNASLIIVGDINPDKAKSQISQYFDGIPSKPLPARTPLNDLKAPGKRSITVQHPQAATPSFIMGFNVPVINPVSLQNPTPDDWEPYALRMLAAVLDEGYSARLESELIRQKELAAHIFIDYTPFSRGDTLLSFTGSPNTSKAIKSEQVVNALWQIINDIKQKPPAASELQRALSQIKAQDIFQQDDITNRSFLLGLFTTLGLPGNWLSQYHQKLGRVTPEQIQKVAQKYLTPARLTTAYLMPEPAGKNYE